MLVEKRGLVKAIILSLVTFGIYVVIWTARMTNEMHAIVGKRTTASGWWAILYMFITSGLYYLYWIYQMSETLNMARAQRGLRFDNGASLIMLLFALLSFGSVSQVLLQRGLNDIIDYDAARVFGGANA